MPGRMTHKGEYAPSALAGAAPYLLPNWDLDYNKGSNRIIVDKAVQLLQQNHEVSQHAFRLGSHMERSHT